MEWPKEIHPGTTRYAVLEALRKLNLPIVVVLLMSGYIILNLVFAILYHRFNACSDAKNFLDYVYFSFVTGTTIGFGEIHPTGCEGKIIVILQAVFSTFYFAMMIAFLGVKFLFPSHTIHFSDNILFDGNRFNFRIVNSHRGLLINPEIRISVVAHSHGNVIAPNIALPKIDTLHWLDNHDFVVSFPNHAAPSGSIFDEWQSAINFQGKSRFKVRITISGTYGMQQYVQVVSYGKDDIVLGKSFKAILYTDEDKKIWRNIRFKRFGDFWTDFNTTF